ncbi:MAG: ABC transporter ATP-binding protein [Pseudonocardia sp.]|nr:ABC transporter ATP-binding protein [Pseudonocardia sp.]
MPLIGVDDMETPYWAQGYEKVAKARLREVAAAVPHTMGVVVRWAWRAAPRLTLFTGVLQLVTGAVQAFGLLATAGVFAGLLAEGPTPDKVAAALPALIVVVAAYAGRGLLDAVLGATQAALLPRVQRVAEDELYVALVGLDLVAFDEPDFTQLVQRVTEGAPDRVRFAVQRTSDLTALVVSMAAAVVTAGVLHPVLAPTVLLAAAPQAWAQVKGAQLAFDSWVRCTSRARRLEVVSELIAQRENAAEVRAFTTQEVLLAEHRRIADDLMVESERVAQRQNRTTTVGRTIAGLGTALGYVVLGLLLHAAAMPLALAGTAALAMRSAAGAIISSMFQVSQLYESGFTLELYRTLIADAKARSRPPGRIPPPAEPAEITLRGVSFRYPDQEEPALRDVSLTFRRGEVIALVGENGSGKSTLAKLLTGLYLPDTGVVAWDGVDIATVDAAALHERIAVVLQDPLHWPMTAANNVRIGRLDRSDPDGVAFANAAARSGADAVLAALPDGAETMLSRQFQQGRDLSGGQWQRLSVARGLYRDAPLVIADEPTAAMDARAEHAVFTALRGLGGTERVTVLVTHRLANVRHADQIVVLEAGRVTELGTHAELMARHGTYHELFSLQARAYADAPSVPG